MLGRAQCKRDGWILASSHMLREAMHSLVWNCKAPEVESINHITTRVCVTHPRSDCPHHCRVLPTALLYFSSGQTFNRALRYWCNTPCPAVTAAAKRHSADANAFKLSDVALVPIVRNQHGQLHRGEKETFVGPPIALTCESDIFRAVGLEYVPPHLRNYENG